MNAREMFNVLGFKLVEKDYTNRGIEISYEKIFPIGVIDVIEFYVDRTYKVYTVDESGRYAAHITITMHKAIQKQMEEMW